MTSAEFEFASHDRYADQLTQFVHILCKVDKTARFSDDTMFVHEPHRPTALGQMAEVDQLTIRLGVALSDDPEKHVDSVTSIRFLGVILDTEAWDARIPRDKLEPALYRLRVFASAKSCTVADL